MSTNHLLRIHEGSAPAAPDGTRAGTRPGDGTTGGGAGPARRSRQGARPVRRARWPVLFDKKHYLIQLVEAGAEPPADAGAIPFDEDGGAGCFWLVPAYPRSGAG